MCSNGVPGIDRAFHSAGKIWLNIHSSWSPRSSLTGKSRLSGLQLSTENKGEQTIILFNFSGWEKKHFPTQI